MRTGFVTLCFVVFVAFIGITRLFLSENQVSLNIQPVLQSTPGCFITPTPIPCNTPVPTSTFPPTITPNATNTPITGGNLVQNPWFADTDCNNSKEGWVDTNNPPWGTGVPKVSNPGPCDTAIRWYYTSHPANVWASIEQIVILPSGTVEIGLQYWFVSLSTGRGEINIYSDANSLIAQSTWSGHSIYWVESDLLLVTIPSGVDSVRIELRAYHEGIGGAKVSGVRIYSNP